MRMGMAMWPCGFDYVELICDLPRRLLELLSYTGGHEIRREAFFCQNGSKSEYFKKLKIGSKKSVDLYHPRLITLPLAAHAHMG